MQCIFKTLAVATCLAAIGYSIASVHAQPVQSSLQWLAKQQQDDGSWPAQFKGDRQKQQTLSANQATGLVLLAYLGAGQTHKDGQYKKMVSQALDYLVRQMNADEMLGDLRGTGDMQSHGVAALAVCETYAMTHDRKLLAPVQLAVLFTERAQDRHSGGWGSQPGEREDMHVLGWQVLTLRAAWLGYLSTRNETLPHMNKYLDGQQIEDGRFYGRIMPGPDPRSTAIGLLARAQAGWKLDDERWREGAQWLVKQGPAEHDVELNFWATQVARRAASDTWATWNKKLRDPIVDRQSHDGDLHGSWYDPKDVHADRGRIYQTALNTLCLEIYYRHLSVFRDEWPGDLKEVKPEKPVVDGDNNADTGDDYDPFGG